MVRTSLFVFAGCALALAGCSGAKEKLGLTRKVPDEFAVVKRAPLSMPPDYELRPPTPGAPRPQEQETAEQARAAVIGGTVVKPAGATRGESALLQQAGAQTTDPNIRQALDAETAEIRQENVPVARKIFGLGPSEDSADVVNPNEELTRLQKVNPPKAMPVIEDPAASAAPKAKPKAASKKKPAKKKTAGKTAPPAKTSATPATPPAPAPATSPGASPGSPAAKPSGGA